MISKPRWRVFNAASDSEEPFAEPSINEAFVKTTSPKHHVGPQDVAISILDGTRGRLRFMTNSEQVEVVIPSDTAAGQQVQDSIIEELEKLGYPHRDVFCWRLALEEAIINAIKHGNKYDPKKTVRVRWKIDSQNVWVEVLDQGEGFKPEAVPDCTLDVNLERTSGRGIMLMRSFLTRVEYNDRGNMVTLEKHREM